jgi:hypothetical protein
MLDSTVVLDNDFIVVEQVVEAVATFQANSGDHQCQTPASFSLLRLTIKADLRFLAKSEQE